MASHSSPVDSDPADRPWHHIEEVLDEVAAAASTARSAAEFYRTLLDRLVPAAGVAAGAVWTAPRTGELRLEYQLELPHAERASSLAPLERRQELVEQVLAAGQPRMVPAGIVPALRSQKATAAVPPGCQMLQPFRLGPQAAGVIELDHPAELSAAERAAYLRLLAAMAELVEDFHRQRELGRLRLREESRHELERFALAAHASLDLRQTAYRIANEGRRITGCDRLSVLVRQGRKYRLAAASGVDVVDRRSKQVRTLEPLVARCAAGGEPLWYCDGAADMPDELTRPLDAYLDESHARLVAIVPLFAPPSESDQTPNRIVGALAAESFQTSEVDAELRDRLTVVAGHGGVALANALEMSHLPLSGVGRLLARVRWLVEARQLPKTLLAAIAVLAAIAALVWIPADFTIEASGELQPQVRRQVFASDDGVVSELLVDHAERVQADQPLVVLKKPELDLELRRVIGEMQTAEKKLSAVRAERLNNDRSQNDQRRDMHHLTADEEELKEQLNGLAQQRAILAAQQKSLVVRSPIGGEALTWNLNQLLAARPVERGQALVTVADLAGPWVVELHVSDHRMGHVLDARQALRSDLPVSFALASQPGTEYEGHIADAAMTTELDDVAGPTVLVTVAIDRNEVAGLRPGATVLARIHCGRRSLGYVWLHEFYEFLQTLWW
ncbi:MAG: GAF domain-containing protein [Pirellulales bacterium]